MKKQELIERLEDLAAFFAIIIPECDRQEKRARGADRTQRADLCSGRATAYRVSFAKLEPIIKEAKR